MEILLSIKPPEIHKTGGLILRDHLGSTANCGNNNPCNVVKSIHPELKFDSKND